MASGPYQPRLIDSELRDLAAELPAIAIDGAKGVGKTATAMQFANTIRNLERPGERLAIEASPASALDGSPPILIDEWQHVPDVWNEVRRHVDSGAQAGRYLLTGSASPETVATHSGAGRIVSLRMRPMSLGERAPGVATVSLRDLLGGGAGTIDGRTDWSASDYAQEILRSGFPGIRRYSDRALRAQLSGYLERIVDRDFAQLEHRLRKPESLRRWMTAYAAASATTTSFDKIRAAAADESGKVQSVAATLPYRDVLSRLWILDPVPSWKPWGASVPRLGSSEKHHLVDPALAATLLGATSSVLVSGKERTPLPVGGSTLLGRLFESLVTQSIRTYAQATEAKTFHLRTHSGDHEVDLIVERTGGGALGVEVKLKPGIEDQDVRDLLWLRERIGNEWIGGVVISAGPTAYCRKDGIAVVPAVLLGPW
ncbi:MAG: ATP-binding protein, partial [Thermoleophilaceae bacterium]|nr:ATP-binding protein [Thermoleophilaceae bacterium]